MVVYQDGQMIKDRIQKICDSFMGSRFEINSLNDKLFDDLDRVRREIGDSRGLLKTSKDQLKQYLISINGDCNEVVPSQLEVMHNHVVAEKAIYLVINQLQSRETSGNFVGFLWAPIEIEDKIREML